mmetsp:Transcript_19059/g.42512  ORF Transcript_19059/g.42512 Transcript_19059/m.42512 type:complete len:219 (+) Transcript_19059:361-1017(+)
MSGLPGCPKPGGEVWTILDGTQDPVYLSGVDHAAAHRRVLHVQHGAAGCGGFRAGLPAAQRWRGGPVRDGRKCFEPEVQQGFLRCGLNLRSDCVLSVLELGGHPLRWHAAPGHLRGLLRLLSHLLLRGPERLLRLSHRRHRGRPSLSVHAVPRCHPGVRGVAHQARLLRHLLPVHLPAHHGLPEHDGALLHAQGQPGDHPHQERHAVARKDERVEAQG